MKQTGGKFDSGDTLEPPSMGPFRFDSALRLVRYPNGGWTIEQEAAERGVMGSFVGAYSDSEDMLDALRENLVT